MEFTPCDPWSSMTNGSMYRPRYLLLRCLGMGGSATPRGHSGTTPAVVLWYEHHTTTTAVMLNAGRFTFPKSWKNTRFAARYPPNPHTGRHLHCRRGRESIDRGGRAFRRTVHTHTQHSLRFCLVLAAHVHSTSSSNRAAEAAEAALIAVEVPLRFRVL